LRTITWFRAGGRRTGQPGLAKIKIIRKSRAPRRAVDDGFFKPELSPDLPVRPNRPTILTFSQDITTLFRRTPRPFPCIALGLALFLAQVGALIEVFRLL